MTRPASGFGRTLFSRWADKRRRGPASRSTGQKLRHEQLEQRTLLAVTDFGPLLADPADALFADSSKAASEQLITTSPTSSTANSGDAVSFDVNYGTNPPASALTGCSLRMHFNSQVLSFDGLGNTLTTGKLFQTPSVNPDTRDYDGDPTTDMYVVTLWLDMNAQWPGTPSARLFTADFTAASDTDVTTNIRFTAVDTPTDWVLNGTPHAVTVHPAAANQPPVIGGLSDSPDPVTVGTTLALTATGVSDPDGTVSKVEFYRETNGTAGLQTGSGGDTLLGADTDASGGWTTNAATTGLAAGTYTYYAQATDDLGEVSAAGSSAPWTTNTVAAQNQAPVVGGLTDSPDPVTAPASVTLTATGVSDPDGSVTGVAFYRETNSLDGLQTGTGGDTLVGSDAVAANGWSAVVTTGGLSAGTYTYYAQATDNQGAVSAAGMSAASADNTVIQAVEQLQVITPSPAQMSVATGDAVSFDVNYATNPPVANLTGASVRIHFNSQALSFDGLTNVLGTGRVFDSPSINADTDDLDGDPATDTYLVTLWMDMGGNWPGVTSTRLCTANFTASDLTGTTTVHFTSVGAPAGWSFSGTPLSINVQQAAATTVADVPDSTLLAGAPLYLPLDGTVPQGGGITYTATSSNPAVAATVLHGRSLKLSTTWTDGTGSHSGDMVLQLFENEAPRTTARIIQLVQQGFYNALLFHRVIDGFVIQGGDPIGTGSGGTGTRFDDEYNADLQFTSKGLLAMAKSTDDSNDCQFFITADSLRYLDFNYSIFGRLVEGDDVRDAISKVATDSSDRPVNNVTIVSATILNDTQNAVLKLSAPIGTTGSSTVTINYSDTHGNSGAQDVAVAVQADVNNDPPVLGTLDRIDVTSGTPTTVIVPAQDLEGDPKYFAAFAAPGQTGFQVAINQSTGSLRIIADTGVTGQKLVYVAVGPSAASISSTDLSTLSANADVQAVPVYITEAPQQLQIVTPSASQLSVQSGGDLSFGASYTTSPAGTNLTGLSLRMHYDSQKLQFNGLRDVYATGRVFEDPSINDDTSDADNDPSTDKYAVMLWMDMNGQWPGPAVAQLFTADFAAIGGAGSTQVRFTSVSSPPEWSLSSTPLAVTILGNQAPVITSLSDSPDPIEASQTLALSALGVSDSDGTVTRVDFYRETNSVAGLQTGAGGDLLVGSDTNSASGWTASVAVTSLSAGSYTYYAQATDDSGATSAGGTAAPKTVNTVAPPSQGVQTISASPSTVGAPAGQAFHFDVQYATNPPSGQTTGLVLRMHYNSRLVSFQQLENVYAFGRAFDTPSINDDTENSDGDSSTDKYVLTLWIDMNGSWPAANPTTLYTADFQALDGAAGTGNIRFMTVDTPPGWTLASTPVAVQVATPVDKPAYSEMVGQNPAAGDVWYSLTAERTGLLTVTADASTEQKSLQLSLFDANFQQLDTPGSHAANRLDQPVTYGQQYYVKLSGSEDSVDVRFANSMRIQNKVLLLYGTSDNDQVQIDAQDKLRIQYKGIPFEFSAGEVTSATFNGLGGVDSATVVGSSAGEQMMITPTQATLSFGSFSVNLQSVEQTAFQGGGGSDTVSLYDSAGNDTLTAGRGAASLTDGGNFLISTSGAAKIQVYAYAGGIDVAALTDTSDVDYFIGTSDYSKIVGGGFFVRTSMFETINATSAAGGADSAALFDSSGNDVFTASPRFGQMSYVGGERTTAASGFRSITGYAKQQGYDQAYLWDSDQTDGFSVTSTQATFAREDYVTTANRFDAVYAYSRGGSDVAYLFDSTGDDTYEGQGLEGTLRYSTGALANVRGFGEIQAFASQGLDIARLSGTSGDDSFLGRPDHARMSGSGYYQWIQSFDQVYAQATAGGTDSALLFDSAGDDLLDISSNQAQLHDAALTSYLLQVTDFSSVSAYATTGINARKIRSPQFTLYYSGNWTDI